MYNVHLCKNNCLELLSRPQERVGHMARARGLQLTQSSCPHASSSQPQFTSRVHDTAPGHEGGRPTAASQTDKCTRARTRSVRQSVCLRDGSPPSPSSVSRADGLAPQTPNLPSDFCPRVKHQQRRPNMLFQDSGHWVVTQGRGDGSACDKPSAEAQECPSQQPRPAGRDEGLEGEARIA